MTIRYTRRVKMKTLITATAFAVILSSPALAEKEPVKPLITECEIKEDIALQMTIYHLDQVQMLIEEMRANILQQYPKKPEDDAKTSG
jgi:hypothetical protein